MKVVISPGNKSLESILSLSVSSTGIAFNVHVLPCYWAFFSINQWLFCNFYSFCTYFYSYKIYVLTYLQNLTTITEILPFDILPVPVHGNIS